MPPPHSRFITPSSPSSPRDRPEGPGRAEALRGLPGTAPSNLRAEWEDRSLRPASPAVDSGQIGVPRAGGKGSTARCDHQNRAAAARGARVAAGCPHAPLQRSCWDAAPRDPPAGPSSHAPAGNVPWGRLPRLPPRDPSPGGASDQLISGLGRTHPAIPLGSSGTGFAAKSRCGARRASSPPPRRGAPQPPPGLSSCYSESGSPGPSAPPAGPLRPQSDLGCLSSPSARSRRAQFPAVGGRSPSARGKGTGSLSPSPSALPARPGRRARLPPLSSRTCSSGVDF